MEENNHKLLLTFGFCLIVAMGYGQDLQSFIKEAIDHNPEIQKVNIQYEIASERINESNWLPNTEVSAGYFLSEPETRVGAQRARFSVRQMVPWFGTISARENYASSLAEAEYINLIVAKRKLALSVSQVYYTLFELREKQGILIENIKLLKTYEQLALKSIEVDQASAVDLLRLQIRQNVLQQEHDVLLQQNKGFEAAMNALLNRKYDTRIDTIAALEIPNIDDIALFDSLSLNPELLKYEKLFESIVQSESLNQRESLPMIGIGVDYIPVQQRTDMNVMDNGKDILMPMVSLSIPIFNQRYKSISRQNELRKTEIQFEKEERFNLLKADLAKAIAIRNQARIKFDTQKINLEQAKNAEEILLRNYETGTINFNDVLDIQELQLKFQLNQIESTRAYFSQWATINYLTL